MFRFVSRWIGAPSTSATSAPVNAWVRYRVSFFRLVFSSFFLFTFFLRQVKSQDASLLGAVILPPSLLASDDNYFLGKPTKKKQQQHQSQHQSRSICFLFSTGDRLLTSWDFYRVLPSFSLIVVGCSGFYLVLLVFFLNFELVCLFCSPRSSGTSCCCCRRFYWPVLRRGTPWRRTGSSLRRLFFLESNRMASSCGRKITRKQTTATAQGASFLSFLFGLVRSGFSAGWYRTGFFYRRRDASFVAAAAVVTAAFTSAILGGRIVVEGLGEYEDGRLYCFDRPRSLSSRTRPFPYCGRNHFSRT